MHDEYARDNVDAWISGFRWVTRVDFSNLLRQAGSIALEQLCGPRNRDLFRVMGPHGGRQAILHVEILGALRTELAFAYGTSLPKLNGIFYNLIGNKP
jgi:hypothetical protein